MRFSGTAPIAAAVAAKAAFGVVVAVFAGTQLTPEIGAGFFQLLMLQSVFVTIISGSAFARAAAISGQIDRAVGAARAQVLVVSIMCIAGLLAVAYFLPADYLGAGEPVFVIAATLMLSGALGALTSLFQGLVVAEVGKLGIFKWIVIGNLVGIALLLVLWDQLSLQQTVIIFCLVQGVSLGGSLGSAYARSLLRMVLDLKTGVRLDFTIGWAGVVNSSYLIAFFVVRELWRADHDPTLVRNIFLLMRASDTVMQIPNLFFASETGRIQRFRHLVGGHWRFCSISALSLFLTVIAFLAACSDRLETQAFPWVWLFGAQIAVDTFRILSLGGVLTMLNRPTLTVYAASVVLSALLGFVATVGFTMHLPTAIHIFLVIFAGGQIAGGVYDASLQERTRTNPP